MKKNLCLLLLLVIFSSCESQVGTAIGTAFTNLFTGKGFSSSSADEMYNEYKEKDANRLAPYDSSLEKCKDPLEALDMVPDKNANLFSKIKDKLCSCKAWGTCDKASCSCEKLCPKSFDILDRGQKNINSPENSLSFNNGDQAFYQQDSNYTGYCWGHALVTQRFNRLATFNSSYKKPFMGEGEESQRLRQYKFIIEKLDNNEPVEIMGFKNLQEFSSDPEVKDLLQESVKKNWAENAMSMQGLSMVTGSDSQGEEYYNKVFDDIEYRLKRHQEPAIVFNQVGDASTAHTVLVSDSGVDSATGRRFICVRDNNFDAAKISNCQKKMYLGKDGQLEYDILPPLIAPKKVGKMKVSYSENSNAVEQIKNLQDHCMKSKDCYSTGTY